MRRLHRRPSFAALLGALALGGCDVFDPSLYQQTSAGITLADRCDNVASLPVVSPSLTTPPVQQLISVDTRPLADQYREFTSCVGNDLPGNDGFFAVDMHVGETWHFHVDIDPASPNADPAIYVLPTCNAQACSPSASSDLCGAGHSEHFSFRPTDDGVQLVGIDSKVAGGSLYSVTVVHQICGNGTLEHGEPCDDGLAQAGVTCDRCHKVLTVVGATEEGVSNDDYVNALVLRPADAAPLAAFPVVGTLGGCDQDMFTFDGAMGTRITATLTPHNGATVCPDGISLTLLRSAIAVAPALTQVPAAATEAMTTTDATNHCPTVTLPSATAAVSWFLLVAAHPSPTTAFPYTLTVTAQ